MARCGGPRGCAPARKEIVRLPARRVFVEGLDGLEKRRERCRPGGRGSTLVSIRTCVSFNLRLWLASFRGPFCPRASNHLKTILFLVAGRVGSYP